MTVATAIDNSAARRAMIDSQLRVSGVNHEAVLAAMSAVAREDFVPATARGHAYIDRAIPLDSKHALPAPLVHGKMLAEAAPQPGERVLVVSCGSNYLPALVEAMGASVEVASIAEAAAGKPGSVGFTLLLIDGAVEHLPAPLVAALAEGGRVVTGLVQRGVTSLASGTKAGGAVQLAPLADIGIPVLAEFAAPKSWSF
jgi:protein-L-isoaspartate(D-aspartate) O-methyltransferase